jgi:hypothetical protein
MRELSSLLQVKIKCREAGNGGSNDSDDDDVVIRITDHFSVL